MKLSGLSFSQSANSMQYRGLQLLDHHLHFSELVSLANFDIPLCFSNSPDGAVPDSISQLDNFFARSEALIFAVSEAGGHYSAAFKNVVDWLIVKNRFNAKLGQGYPLSNKPVFILTFTPTHSHSGDRHFNLTRYLIEEKFGAMVLDCFVFHKCWEKLLPNNFEFVENAAVEIKKSLQSFQEKPVDTNHSTEATYAYDIEKWLKQYKQWNSKWME